MFRKLISSLPFSPSLIYQLAIYAKRLKFETKIRTAGSIIASLAVGLQLFGQLILPYQAGVQPRPHQEVLGVSTITAAGSNMEASPLKPAQSPAAAAPASWLPYISPVEGFLLSLAFLLMAAFFCLRDRLLARELDIIKADFTSGGGV